MSTDPYPEGVERDDRPVLASLEFVPIYSAVVNSNLHLICLSHQVYGVWTHYHLERTIPCMGRSKGCLCATVELSRRWKGYLAAWEPLASRVVLAEVTSDCYRSAEHNLSGTNGSLRGRAFILFRLGSRRNGPVRITFGARLPNFDEKLPAEPDVMRCLRRIWGVPER